MPPRTAAAAPGRPHFFRRGIGWWYWLATAGLLTAACPLGRAEALPAAIVLTAVQLCHYLLREKGRVAAFPVQVRLAYLGLLAVGLADPLAFVHWAQMLGTWALVLAGYCPLARLLALAPWNRSRPFSLDLMRRVLLSPPVAGPATALVDEPSAESLRPA